jgi:hypothetical protein
LKPFETLCAFVCLAAASVLGALPGGLTIKSAGPCGRDLCECALRADAPYRLGENADVTANEGASRACCARPAAVSNLHLGAAFQPAAPSSFSSYGLLYAQPAPRQTVPIVALEAPLPPLNLRARVPLARAFDVPTPPPRA